MEINYTTPNIVFLQFFCNKVVRRWIWFRIYSAMCVSYKSYQNASAVVSYPPVPPVFGKSLPLRVQVILGVGLPRVAHFRETRGPGCIV